MTPGEQAQQRRDWERKKPVWQRIARARAATASMTLAKLWRHEIFVVVPDWREWPVAPWYTSKLRTWQLSTPRQRAFTLLRVSKYMSQGTGWTCSGGSTSG